MYIHLRNLVLLGITTLIVLFVAAPFDLSLGLYAREHSIHFLEDFFNLSIFLDGVLGLADIVVFFVLGALVIYFVSFFSWGKSVRGLRNYSGYIFATSFAMAISLVHAVKWALSRARPYDVFPNHMELFTHWYVPGTYTLEVGFNKGSFPSGHVATMSVLIALFFLMPKNTRSWIVVRWTYIAFVFAIAMLMGWYRMMYGSHWFSDNVASLMLSMVVGYFFYHFLFFPSPETRQRYPRFNTVELRRPSWAIQLTWQLLFWGFSIATIFVGIRILLQEKFLHGSLVMLVGIVLSYFFYNVTWKALFGPFKGKRLTSTD